MVKLTIIRGPSGSGKSTIARHLGGVARENWFEADMFFERNGHYVFEAHKLGVAHGWCQESVLNSLLAGKDTIVSNTTPSQETLNSYLNIAAKVPGVEICIIRSPGPWRLDVLKVRNLHNCPSKSIERMINQYVKHPDEKEWTDLSIFK